MENSMAEMDVCAYYVSCCLYNLFIWVMYIEYSLASVCSPST